MIRRGIQHATVAVGHLAGVLVILLPLAAVAYRLAIHWKPLPAEATSFAAHGALLGKTIGLSACAVVGALVLSLPGAYVVGRVPRPAAAAGTIVCILCPLLIPPMITTFGWQRVLGPPWPWVAEWSPSVRCVSMWSLWAWPIPALLIGAGWSRIGRALYETALLDCRPGMALIRTARGGLWRHALAAALIVWILLLTEYSVPHANGLLVWSTEMLGLAQSLDLGTGLVLATRMSWPLLIAVGAAAWALTALWPLGPGSSQDSIGLPGEVPVGRWVRVTTAVIVGVTWFPIVVLAWRGTLVAEIGEALGTYASELAKSWAVCVAAAVVATLIGLASSSTRLNFRVTRPRFGTQTVAPPGLVGHLDDCPGADAPGYLPPPLRGYLKTQPGRGTSLTGGKWGRLYLLGALFFAAAPGAVVGEAVLAAYQPIDVVYDGPALTIVGLSARFAWVAILGVWLARRSVPARVIESARVDGADALSVRCFLPLRVYWPTVVCGGVFVTATAMAEVCVSSLVQVPSVPMIARILIEKFHRFETGMLVALSLCLVSCVIPVMVLAVVAVRRLRW